MRHPTGCENCRQRHVKCEIPVGSEKCLKCEERNEECSRRSPLRFKEVTSISERTNQGKTEKRKIQYEDDQKWTRMTGPVNFVGDGEDGKHTTSGSPSELCSYQRAGEPSASKNRTSSIKNTHSSNVYSHPRSSTTYMTSATNAIELNTPVSVNDERTEPPTPSSAHGTVPGTPAPGLLHTQQPEKLHHPNNTATFQSAALQERVGRGIEHQAFRTSDSSPNQQRRGDNVLPPLRSMSWAQRPTVPPLYRTESEQPISSRKEARLLQHFIEKQAPELDVCDMYSRFARDVPRRAMYVPALMNAILAFAARNMSVISGQDDEDSAYYHSLCLQSLIPALDNPSDVVDENLLTTVVILRLYEERARIKEEYHRLGQTRLLNSISAWAASGGIAEAATWLSLRQEIRVSFTNKQAMRIRLDNYAGSRVFIHEDEGCWANRIIYITARVLAGIFQDNGEISRQEWIQLENEVDAWDAQKPRSFEPLWTDTKSPAEARSRQQARASAFPEIIMSQGTHAVAAQYFSTSKLLLATHNPHIPRLGFSAFTLRRDADRLAVDHLRDIVGLAMSNKACLTASVTATYVLDSCGGWLTDPREQEEILDFLLGIERLVGWTTGHIISSLRSQWMAAG